jgi:transposase InsO family protein
MTRTINNFREQQNETLSFACQLFGVDRQVYYRAIRKKQYKVDIATQVVKLVDTIRLSMPRVGSKKLYYLLNDELKALKVGRDKFIAILRANHLLVKTKRRYHVTTNSYHRFRKHGNLILDLPIHKPEQVWVADITYIGNKATPCYLSLITDAYSKKVMGYFVSGDLTTSSSVKALRMALRQREDETLPLIHHSDRGIQYCADLYQQVLYKNDVQCSMTQDSDPYENAVAERINGILKQEFMIDQVGKELDVIRQVVKESIQIYNQQRPHYSNHLLTPNQMHAQNKIKMKTYKTKNSSNPKATTI